MFHQANKCQEVMVFFATPGIHLLIKWTKTIQTRDTIGMLKISHLSSSPLCPVQAIKNLLLNTPGTENSPLFQVKNEAAQWVPLTDTKVRHNFTQILTRLDLQHSGISLHTFRHSGSNSGFQLKCVYSEHTEPRHLDV